jgi:hypothetical protein
MNHLGIEPFKGTEIGKAVCRKTKSCEQMVAGLRKL